MNKKSITAVIVSLLILGTVGVVLTTNFHPSPIKEKTEKPKDETPIHLGNIISFDDAVNAFSFDVFKKFFNDTQNEGNIFTSPYSIFTALAMTYEGAKGTTADEMKKVLNIEQNNESFHEYMQSLYQYLNTNKSYNISTANALWIKENYPLLKEYKNLILTYYGGNSTDMNFSNPEHAAKIINGWIENKTHNLIKNLISPGNIDPVLTDLILTNAIYFKGTWQIQFDEKNTTEKSFKISKEKYIDIETMRFIGTHNQFNYTENQIMQMVELPYTGNEMSMTILLPKEGYTTQDIIRSMNHMSYKELIDSMNNTELDISLPKFKIETPLYTLNNYLKELGMPTAFTGDADFSGMNGFGQLCISSVLHKAFIEVNEKGTEAAAATAVIMVTSAYPGQNVTPRIVFNADHPFIFLIQHKTTDTILFMGEVTDPST
ncbi:Serpin (serine protease inhibitor) [uncultured archaeon]|nr:Serpin (serine protease inhibitor) [uncultured archaeon]